MKADKFLKGDTVGYVKGDLTIHCKILNKWNQDHYAIGFLGVTKIINEIDLIKIKDKDVLEIDSKKGDLKKLTKDKLISKIIDLKSTLHLASSSDLVEVSEMNTEISKENTNLKSHIEQLEDEINNLETDLSELREEVFFNKFDLSITQASELEEILENFAKKHCLKVNL